jgi:hypothetical protein
MLFKRIIAAFLITATAISFSNKCEAAVGYVVFGNPPSCSSTGICSSSLSSGMYQGTTPTEVSFIATPNADNTQCNVTMTISMNALKINQPEQFTNFSTGNYVFMNSAKITGVLLGGAYFSSNPQAYVMIPANFPVSVPPVNAEGVNKVTISLGMLPIIQ